jgi:hypothetical protein
MKPTRFTSLAAAIAVLTLGLAVTPADAAPTPAIAGADAVASLDLAPAAKKAKPTLTVALLGSTQYKGVTNTTVYTKVTVKGKAAAGKIKITEGKKTLKSAKLKKGVAFLKLPKSLAVGVHNLKIAYLPASPAKTAGASESGGFIVATPTAEQSANLGSAYCTVMRKQAATFAPTFIDMGLDPNANIPKATLVKTAKALAAIAAAAPTPEVQETWSGLADSLSVMAGKMTLDEIVAKHPGTFDDPEAVGNQIGNLVSADAPACGAM